MDRFQQECAFLESIRHPNIVQYLGMTRDPESRLPVLLMELLSDENLTKMLEHSQQSLAYYVQVDICHDIALAVTYLHSNDIIHRDLSSNNVLMIAGRRAKVTDFGMSKLADTTPRMTPLTMCSGTEVYMPPEALRDPPRYTEKLDCFSEGVIMIQVCTRLWPEPGPRTERRVDPSSPTGEVEVPILETDRRKSHINLIDPNHTLLLIATDCLKFQDKDRPSSEELCQRLADLKESREYRENVQTHRDEIQAKDTQIKAQIQQLEEKGKVLQERIDETTLLHQQLHDKDSQLQQLNQQFQEKDQLLHQRGEEMKSQHKQLQDIERLLQARASENASLIQQFQDKDAIILDKDNQLQRLKQQIQEKDQLLPERGKEIQDKDDQFQQHNSMYPKKIASQGRQLLQLNQQLNEQEQVMGGQQSIIGSPQRLVEHLQQELSPQSIKSKKSSSPLKGRHRRELLKQFQVQLSPQVKLQVETNKAILSWKDGARAPFKMSRGATVVDGNVGYFVNWYGDMCSYNLSSKRWRELPPCPNQHCSLVIINGQLTAIGGKDIHSKFTNKLLSLKAVWKEVFPPMSIKRCSTTAVTMKEHVIVAGGATALDLCISTVEVMNIRTLLWSSVASLPHAYDYASGNICGDQLYMLGGWDNKNKTKSVLTCSLIELLQSSSSSSDSSVWHSVAQ